MARRVTPEAIDEAGDPSAFCSEAGAQPPPYFERGRLCGCSGWLPLAFGEGRGTSQSSPGFSEAERPSVLAVRGGVVAAGLRRRLRYSRGAAGCHDLEHGCFCGGSSGMIRLLGLVALLIYPATVE